MSTFLYTVAGIVFGGIVSAVISYYFSRQASAELRREAERLRRETDDVRHYINAQISYLEAAGSIRVVRDEDGRPIETQIIRLSGVMEGGGTAWVGEPTTIGEPALDQDDPPPEAGQGGEGQER